MAEVNLNQDLQAQIDHKSDGFVEKKSASSERLSEIIEQVTEIARRMLNASGSSVLLIDEKDRGLTFKVATGKVKSQLTGLRIGAKNGIASWVAQYGEPLIVNDAAEDWRFDKIADTVTGFTTKSVVCAPLMVGSKVVGVIEVVNKQDGKNFKDSDLEMLQSIAQVAVLSIMYLKSENSSGITS
jgi:phosphoserine phosphatase RsbU/P